MPRGISRYDEAAIQGRLWTPSTIISLMAAWYDASDLTTITDSGTGISQWADKGIGAFNATQPTSINQPTFLPLEINNKSAISFDSPKGLITSLSASSSAETIMMVGRKTSANTCTILGSNTAGGRQFRVTNGAQLEFLRQNQAVLASSGATIPLSANVMIGLTYDSTETRFYCNGNQLGSTVTVSPALIAGKTSVIGYNGGLSLEYWQGPMAEIVVFQSVLSLYVRQQIEGYLAWKWGLVDILEASHPFISRPPTIGD